MTGQMVIAIALPGFNDLERTVTPVFLLMDHFLYQLSAVCEKMKKIYRRQVRIFLKKCTIAFRYFSLFAHQCDSFKYILKD